MRKAALIAVCLLPAVAFAQAGWRKEGGEGEWARRDDHNAAAFNGRLWVFNGRQSAPKQDLWSTSDATTWTEELTSLPWHNRVDAASAVHDGRIWMLGGTWSGMFMADVWSTDDGVNWTEQTPAAPWSTRVEHQAVAFDNKLWVIGGVHLQRPWLHMLNDLWHTQDGVNWTQQTITTIWPGRVGHACVAHNGRLWVLGGFDGQNFRNDVWSSPDGTTWTEETAAAPWDPRARFTATTYAGRIWVIGGYDWINRYEYGDVWSSEDGKTWRYEGQPWVVRENHATVVFKGRLWVVGGVNETTFPGDVWSYGLYMIPHVLPAGIKEVPYSAVIEAREGDGPYTWSLKGGTVPPGLTLDLSSTSAMIPVTGAPANTGKFTFTLRVEDQGTGDWAEETITLTIKPQFTNKEEAQAGACTATPSQAGTGARGTSTAVLWLAWLAALTAATITLRHRAVVAASAHLP